MTETPDHVDKNACQFDMRLWSIYYTNCPYIYPCGAKPCEKGEECPGKPKPVPIIVPWPISPYPWTPGDIIYSQSGGYQYAVPE